MSSTCGPSRCTSARTGATTTAGARSPPSRSRHMMRRRRPIVSSAGDTRSNGSVSHAGNSSTVVGAEHRHEVAREPLGLGRGRDREQDRARPGQPVDPRGEQRARRFGDRDDLAATGRDRGDARILGQEPRQLGQRRRSHLRTMTSSRPGRTDWVATPKLPGGRSTDRSRLSPCGGPAQVGDWPMRPRTSVVL